MRILFLVSLMLLCYGCSTEVIKLQTQEIYIPVRCEAALPQKPTEDGSFQSHKAISIYYLQVENTLKDCLGLNQE